MFARAAPGSWQQSFPAFAKDGFLELRRALLAFESTGKRRRSQSGRRSVFRGDNCTQEQQAEMLPKSPKRRSVARF